MLGNQLGALLIARRLLIIFLCAGHLFAAKLRPVTLEAFEQYVQRNEARIEAELRNGGPFLWIDGQPETRRESLHARLQQGEIVAENLRPGEANVPHGLIHHWVGLVFVPGVTLEQSAALVMDYDEYQVIHRPYIVRSKVIRRDGNDARIYLRLYKKKALTVVLDTEHEVHYVPLDSTRAHSRTLSTHIVEVKNRGKPEERQRPVGDDRGFLWRHISYWRFLQKDSGTYVQCEALALSRDLPAVLGWVIGAFLKGVHKEFLFDMVNGTRAGLLSRHPVN